MAEQRAMSSTTHPSQMVQNPLQRFLIATEIDTRLLGMIGALAIIWVGFNFFSGGLFLTPRNLWNLSVQTASVAVMVTGMVLVIVTRNIDLSVGSILGVVGMVMGVMQTQILPVQLGSVSAIR
jgi:D-xylose transport system permease protein